MTAVIRRFWCWVMTRGGHLPVVRRGNRTMREHCYLCDAPLGRGWDFRDVHPPRYLIGTMRFRLTADPRRFREAMAGVRRRLGGVA